MSYPSNSESVAQDQIKAFTARVVALRLQRQREHYEAIGYPLPSTRPHYAPYYACGERLPSKRATNGLSRADAEFWLEMCSDLCRFAADDFDHETRRGWVIACRILGLSWRDRENALGDVYSYGAKEGAAHWAPFLSVPDPRFVDGWVYTAVAAGRPEIIKVGFSKTPDKRMKQLARAEGREVTMLTATAGTMLHEWALHQHILRQVKPEWYPVAQVPTWLLANDLAAVA